MIEDKRPKCSMYQRDEGLCGRPLAIKQVRQVGNVACILQCPRGHWVPADQGVLDHMMDIGWGPKK